MAEEQEQVSQLTIKLAYELHEMIYGELQRRLTPNQFHLVTIYESLYLSAAQCDGTIQTNDQGRRNAASELLYAIRDAVRWLPEDHGETLLNAARDVVGADDA
jgi:hypothetical protein